MIASLVQCAWCGALKADGTEWVRPSVRLPLIQRIVVEAMDGASTEHDVSHGICDRCEAEVVGLLREWEAEEAEAAVEPPLPVGG